MKIPLSSRPVAVARRDRDRGSVLTMVLCLMVVGSLAVFALLNLATVLFMNRPPIEIRDRTFWSAKSAVSIAMVEQASYGPNGCYDGYKVFTLNGFAATVSCQADAPVTSGRGRFAVVTTSNDPNTSQLRGVGPGAAIKEISGSAFVNAGRIDATSADLNIAGGVTLSTFLSPQTPAARYLDYSTPVAPAPPVATDCATNPVILMQTAGALPSPVAPVCTTIATAPDTNTSWQAYVGDREDASTARGYPVLPPLPPYTRPSTNQATVGACKVYFPGQYNSPITLGPGDHYFASGIYYFTDVVTLQSGASVVAGQGKFDGCTVDALAVYATDAPKAHSVTGRGATFVFGGAGRLISDNASLLMNKRVSDASTRGSEYTAFRSVNFRPAAAPPPAVPATVEIPDDLVMITDTHDAANPKCTASVAGQPCLQAARDYTSQASADSAVKSYTPSTLGVNDTIISITQTGGNSSSNRFDVDGYTFVPNSRVLFNGGNNADYRTNIDGGIVASSLELRYNLAPSNASNWFLGVRETNLEQRFNFYANVDAGNGQRTVSRATLQVDESGNYAINGWTVDPNAQGTPPPPPVTTTTTTTPPTTTTTTTIPPTTTSTTTTTTTTTTPPTTTTTTLPPPVGTVGAPCNVTAGSFTRNFGAGTWSAEYWNKTSFSTPPTTPFAGVPTTANVAEVRKVNDTLGPQAGINADYYTARFTKTFVTNAACTISLRRGSDDGMRIKVNGVTVMDDWATYGYKTTTVNNVALAAGTNTIVVEYYEQTGESGYSLEWRS